MDSTSTVLHPASGALILGLDWLFFSGSVISLGLSTPTLTALGFLLGALGTGWLQRRYGGDGTGISSVKGLLGGIAVGLPLPIAGTVLGGAILTLSGLNRYLRLGRSSDESNEGPER